MSLQLSSRSRREALLGLVALGLAPKAAYGGEPSALDFEALRNGRRIGRQTTAFERRDGSLTVRTRAEMSVGLGPITLYRYLHEATEQWERGQFVALRTRTSQNGRVIQVAAERAGGAVRIEQASGQRITAPDRAVPFSHWNRAIAGRPLFNPQDGKMLREHAAPPEPASVLTASGAAVPGVRVPYRGEVQIDDFYDQGGVWLALAGRLSDGSRLEYRRL